MEILRNSTLPEAVWTSDEEAAQGFEDHDANVILQCPPYIRLCLQPIVIGAVRGCG